MPNDNKTNTAIQKKKPERDEFMAPVADAKSIADLVTLAEEQLTAASGGKLDVQRVARLAVLTRIAAQKVPLLLQCTRSSLYWAFLDAARCGLEWDGNQGALIPYRNSKKGIVEAQFQPMVAGLIHLVGEAGVCVDIDAVPVFRGEHFEVRGGTNRGIDHVVAMDVERTYENLRAAYAVFHLRSGAVKFDVLSRQEIDERRKMSRATSGPWFDWPVEMARKTVVKHGIKLLPRLSTTAADRVASAVDIDNRAETGERSLSAEDGRLALPGMMAPPPPSNRGIDGLRDALGRGAEERMPPAEMTDEEREENERAAAERAAAGET